jgi:hypothetical protein
LERIGIAAATTPTTIIQKPTLFKVRFLSGRLRPKIILKVKKPMMKKVVQTRAFNTP